MESVRRIKGVVYDTGMDACLGENMLPLNIGECRREMQIIHDDLHCNAVRILGSDFKNLEGASEECLKQGMEAWIAPYLIDRNKDEMLKLLVECAEMAERLRLKYPDTRVVYIAGGEFFLYMKGILEGETFMERTAALAASGNDFPAMLEGIKKKMDVIMPEIAAKVRKVFHGEVTYATMAMDPIDWSLFDFISLDHYRSSYNKETYGEELRPFVESGMPVVIMEIGLCTFTGADDMGSLGHTIITGGDDGLCIAGDYVRNETLQASELSDMMNICDKEGVVGQFVFYFKEESMTYSEDPHKDLDMGCYGLVKCYADRYGSVYPDMRWDPKESFYAVAKHFAG